MTVALGGRAEPPSPAAEPPVILLLRNGQVIEGHVECQGEYYCVTRPDQVLQVRASSVEFLCRDLRDGYSRKKALIQPTNINQHLELFLWCERHGLYDCAGEELNAAERIDRDHPMIPVLRRRLKIEMQEKNQPAVAAKGGPPLPSDEQLDQMTRGMPPGAVEMFVQVVQPILLNRCPGARGYELPGQQRLQLMRPPLGQGASRRITQRNLHAVLQHIDWDHPGESPLLKASTGPSANGSLGAFPGRHSSQYQKIVQWVYLVTQKPMPAGELLGGGVEAASFAELAGDGSASPGAQAGSGRGVSRLPYIPSTAGDKDRRDAGKDNSAKGGSAPPGKTLGSSPLLRRGSAAAAAIEGIDPYDPAAFNSQAGTPAAVPTPAARVLHGDK